MQTAQAVAWTEKYRPDSIVRVLGNEENVKEFNAWMKHWTLKRKPTKACLLVGPPGVGKTTLARAAATDYGFRVVELNASDIRTEKRIRSILEPATNSATLDSFSTQSRGNMILLDEVDGVFGREDRGGLGAILDAIKGSPLPVVLTANNVDDERFDDLKKACTIIRMYEIRPRLLVAAINAVLLAEGKSVDASIVNRLAENSRGDIRSAINDVQAVATSKIDTLRPNRTDELNEAQTLDRLFAGEGFSAARRALNETEIPLYRDELLLLIHDILPYLYTSREKLATAYEALSRADIGYGVVGASRSRNMTPPPFNMPRRDHVPEWSLLPAALNEMATVGFQKTDEDVDHALEVSPRISKKIADRYQYRLWALEHLASRNARVCHMSKLKARKYMIPTLIALFRIDEAQARKIAVGLELEERDIEFLASEGKTRPASSGEPDLLDPTGFKLPFMGKDKFIQLMRAGISYDRNRGQFAVRRLDNLDTVEERLAGIVSRPVKFVRQPADNLRRENLGLQECYVDGNQVSCSECEFIESCPTHDVPSLKFCLCPETAADPRAYELYVAKSSSIGEQPKKPPRAGKPVKQRGERRKRLVRSNQADNVA